MELCSPKIKKFLIFSQKRFPNILGNGTLSKNTGKQWNYFKNKLSELAKLKNPL